MAREPTKPRGLKISQLARLAEVSIPTIKHYLREGLIPRPVKTGRTMSYYDPECVERVRKIKRLQTERFLPLSAIKKIIKSGKSIEDELALGEAMMCVSEVSAPGRCITRDEIEKQLGYSVADLDKMERLGLVRPRKTGRQKEYDPVDCQILSLIRQREEAGFPLDYSLDMMSMYRRHIQTIVREDAKFFVRRLLPDASLREAAKYIREGDRALGAFMPLIRKKLARAHAERIIEAMDGASRPIREALRFRLLPEEAGKGGEPISAEGSNGPFRSSFLRFLRRKETLTNADTVAAGDAAGLFIGLRHLATGRVEEACVLFKGTGRCESVGPLSEALEGIALILKAAQAPGLLAGLQVLKEAVGCLQGSRRRAPDPDVGLLASYFRGIGFAVIPDLFDTHGEADRELTPFVCARRKRAADPGDPFHRELRMKACYFLAAMHVEDEAYEQAEKVLAKLLKRGGDNFYSRWAAGQRKRIAKIQRGLS